MQFQIYLNYTQINGAFFFFFFGEFLHQITFVWELDINFAFLIIKHRLSFLRLLMSFGSIQSWFHTASLPVRFWRSKFLRPVAPKSVTPPLAQNSSLTLLTPRKPRETVHFTHLLHKIHFRTSPAKSRDVIHSRPHQINLQYLARPNRPGENRRFQTANQILHRLRASAAAAFSDAPPRTLRQPSPVT